MVPELKDLTYKERLKEKQMTTLKDGRERGELITIYKLMNNLEETDRKYLILRRKGYLRREEKVAKRNLLERHKKVKFFPEKYSRYLEWIERSSDNGKECTATDGKTGPI